MTIKGLVFDKDGTLFHYAATWGMWCRNVLLDLTKGDLEKARKMGFDVGYRWDADSFVTGAPIVNGAADEVNAIWAAELPELAMDEIEAVCVKHLETTPAAPVCDFDALFGVLKAKGFRLGVATNDFEAGAVSQLEAHKAKQYFDFICGYDSGYGAKPGPGMILGFCEETGLLPSEVAMVGDSTHDLLAGEAANVGLKIGVLTGPASARDIEAAADVVLEDISKIPAYLDQR